MRSREDSIEWDRRYCQHYDPAGVTMVGGKEPHGHCKAGVVYLEQFGAGDGIFQRMCCTRGGVRTEEEQLASCPRWERRTVEQATERAHEIEGLLQRMRLVSPIVAEWRTWTRSNKVAKDEIVECPVCKARLHLSQAAYNGHVWGKCETVGCVSWME